MYSINEGYIIYKRGDKHGPSSYWRRIYEQNVHEASQLDYFYKGMQKDDKLLDAADKIVDLGYRERQNELALLKAAGIELEDEDDIKNFVKHFNEVLMGKEQFGYAVTRLKEALREEHKKSNNRAPTIASWFTSYLSTAIRSRISRLINDNSQSLLKRDFSKLEEDFESVIDDAINTALKNMLTEVKKVDGKELYGDSSMWSELYYAMQSIQGMPESFREMIKSKINFSAIKQIIKELTPAEINDKRHKGLKKKIDSAKGLNFISEQRSRSVGGNVEEYLNASLAGVPNKVVVSDKSAVVLKSEIAKTDTVTFLQFQTGIDIDKFASAITSELDEQIFNSSTLKDTVNTMDKFYKDKLSKIDNSFIVYSSVKSYSMSESFIQGFSGGGTRKLEDIKYILDESGLGSAEDYLNIAYNTATGASSNEPGADPRGALFEDERDEVKENLKISLMSAVARLLFDDWTTIGLETSTGAKAIHVLALEGIQLPLSVLLIATGNAIIETERNLANYINVFVKLPGAIKFPAPQESINGDAEATHQKVKKNWNEQMEEAHNDSKFSIKFLRNFKNLILDYIDF